MSDHTVFLSAAPTARRHVTPEIVAGCEFEIKGDRTEIVLWAPVVSLGVPSGEPSGSVAPEGVDLRARWTGASYRGLPWWEVRLAGDWP